MLSQELMAMSRMWYCFIEFIVEVHESQDMYKMQQFFETYIYIFIIKQHLFLGRYPASSNIVFEYILHKCSQVSCIGLWLEAFLERLKKGLAYVNAICLHWFLNYAVRVQHGNLFLSVEADLQSEKINSVFCS
jgi:hypothetical protein